MKVAPAGTDIRRFDDDASALQAMIVGQIDAAGTSSVIAAELHKRYPDQFQIKYVINEQVMGVTMQYKRPDMLSAVRTEARRVGKECVRQSRSRGSPSP